MEKDTEFTKLQNNAQTTVQICNGLGKKSQDSQKPLGERRKAVFRQLLMVIFGNMTVLSAGMAVALPSATLGQLTDPNESFHMDKEEASWYSSINSMACPVGGLIVGYSMDKFGRKKTMLITNVTGIIAWGLLCTATFHTTHTAIYAQTIIARFISGIMMGLCFSPVGAYSAEISMPKTRGRLILCSSIAIGAGIFLMYIFGYFIRRNWQLIAMIICIYQIISLLCVLPLPESPSWLTQCGKHEKARKSLKYFRGLKNKDTYYCVEFEEEFAQITKNTEISRITAESETSFWSTLKAPEVYKPLVIMLGFFAFQNLAGVVIVVVFAVQIAANAGVTTDPALCAVFVGLARMITTFFMSHIFEKWGRKPAGMFSAGGMAICMFLLAISGWFDLNSAMQILLVICIVLHIVFTTMGLLTLPIFMISEVFPQRVRGAASGTTVCCGMFFSFFAVKVYPGMEEKFGTPAAFAFFGFMSLGALLYIYFLIPETRGRTLLEIEEYFRSGKTLCFENTTHKSKNFDLTNEKLNR